MKRRFLRYAAFLLVFMYLMSFPLAVFAETPEEAESFARENYEAAQDNLNNIYYNALNSLNSEDSLLTQDRPLTEKLYYTFFNIYRAIASAAPMICLLSMAIGLFIFILARRNKVVQRFALVFLIILIPVLTIAFVYGVGSSKLFKAA